jgi:hypothetical protein
LERADHKAVNHSATQARIAPYGESETFVVATLEESCESSSKFHDIDGRQSVASMATYGASDA